MDYEATYLNAYIHFHAIYTILILDTDNANIFMPKSRIRIAAYYHLENKSNSKPHPGLNGSILIEYKTLNNVVESAD